MSETKTNTTISEDELLEEAARDNGVNPDLLRELLDVRRRDFPSLDKWGAKTNFENAVGDLVKKAARQAEQTTEI